MNLWWLGNQLLTGSLGGGDNLYSTGPVLLLGFLWYNACIIFKEKSLYAIFYVSGLQIIIVMQVEIDSVCKNKILG